MQKLISKKRKATGLMLVIGIIGMLSLIIMANYKLITGSHKTFTMRGIDTDSKYANTNSQNGFYACYKKYIDGEWKLYETRYILDTGGTVTTHTREKEVTECNFETPDTSFKYNLIVVGAGGGGSVVPNPITKTIEYTNFYDEEIKPINIELKPDNSGNSIVYGEFPNAMPLQFCYGDNLTSQTNTSLPEGNQREQSEACTQNYHEQVDSLIATTGSSNGQGNTLTLKNEGYNYSCSFTLSKDIAIHNLKHHTSTSTEEITNPEVDDETGETNVIVTETKKKYDLCLTTSTDVCACASKDTEECRETTATDCFLMFRTLTLADGTTLTDECRYDGAMCSNYIQLKNGEETELPENATTSEFNYGHTHFTHTYKRNNVQISLAEQGEAGKITSKTVTNMPNLVTIKKDEIGNGGLGAYFASDGTIIEAEKGGLTAVTIAGIKYSANGGEAGGVSANYHFYDITRGYGAQPTEQTGTTKVTISIPNNDYSALVEKEIEVAEYEPVEVASINIGNAVDIDQIPPYAKTKFYGTLEGNASVEIEEEFDSKGVLKDTKYTIINSQRPGSSGAGGLYISDGIKKYITPYIYNAGIAPETLNLNRSDAGSGAGGAVIIFW